MKDLFAHWHDARRGIKDLRRMLWLFDFDGTLAPIAAHPKKAVMPSRVRRLLKKLNARYPGKVGVLSGRPIDQLRRKVGVPDLLYGGAHGFEIQAPGIHWRRRLSASRKKRLHLLAVEITRVLLGRRGLWLEDKRWSLCIHFRSVRRQDRARTEQLLRWICNQARRRGFKLQKGLKALEIFSDSHWDKGRAVQWLRERCRVRDVFYAGDDVTDETVFQALKRPSITVRMGLSESSQARYYVKRQSNSEKLLERILTL